MPLYVVALTDTALEPFIALDREWRSMRLPGGVFAVCERRDSPPPLTDDELRAQHNLVIELASRVDALLPVRFGACLGKTALMTLVREHIGEITQGLDEVRGRVQMTIRLLGDRPSQPAVVASTGRDYLEQRRRAASPLLPAAGRALLKALHALVARERQEPGAGRLLATVYHLVAASDIPAYQQTAHRLRSSAILVTGPWPPFAFTPQIW